MNERSAWRVLLYMSADNALDAAAAANLADLEFAARAGNVTLAIQIDRSGQDSMPAWPGTRRLIWKPAAAEPVHSREDLGVQNLADAGVLRDFLQWADERAPADHTLLVLWGHGTAHLGLLRDEGARATMSVAGLERALDGRTVDVLAMDLCFMQSLEVARALETHATFLVGSETARSASGWPYRRLIEYVFSSPERAPRQVAAWLAEAVNPSGDPSTTSALQLAELDALDQAFTATLRAAASSSLAAPAVIGHHLDQLPWMSRPAQTVDLGAALEILARAAPDPARNAKQLFANALVTTKSSDSSRSATGLAVSRRALFIAGLPDPKSSRRSAKPLALPRVTLRTAEMPELGVGAINRGDSPPRAVPLAEARCDLSVPPQR